MQKELSIVPSIPLLSKRSKKRLLGRSRDLKQLKEGLQLTGLQKRILPGILLGDAHLSTQDHGTTYRLHVYQDIKHKEYVYHLYEIFKELCLLEPTIKERTHRTGLCKGRTYQMIAFKTVSTPLFKFYATLFNCNSQPKGLFLRNQPNKSLTERVPREIHRWLTPIGLAYWYMDDGSMKGKTSKAVYFNTQGFSFKEVESLCGVLINKSRCLAKPVKKKGQDVIYVSAKSFSNLKDHIYPFLIKEMLYKLPLDRSN